MPAPDYSAVNCLLRDAGLIDRLVMQTPRWQDAEARVREYCSVRGWNCAPMGPVPHDTWSNWLHILSHTLDGDHGHSHARCELDLAHIVTEALRDSSDS